MKARDRVRDRVRDKVRVRVRVRVRKELGCLEAHDGLVVLDGLELRRVLEGRLLDEAAHREQCEHLQASARGEQHLGRCREIHGDTRRYREIYGDVGRYRGSMRRSTLAREAYAGPALSGTIRKEPGGGEVEGEGEGEGEGEREGEGEGDGAGAGAGEGAGAGSSGRPRPPLSA